MARVWFRSALGAALVSLALATASQAADRPASEPRIEEALTNILTLSRPNQDGLATVWDGNKYVQCRHLADRTLRCEAAGALLQPSLAAVLTQERVAKLSALGWHLEPAFGNYVQILPADQPPGQIADKLAEALRQGYDADLANLQVETDWIPSQRCPPRNGPGQNLAGLINNARSMASTAIYGCAYVPAELPPIHSAADLIAFYGARVTGEVQRLRVNASRRVFLVLQAGAGYLQCEPQTSPDAFYCEAESAYSWPVLSQILTAERIGILHKAGFADPGRSSNYWRDYPFADFDDATVAHALLTILYDAYGYSGTPKLVIRTEKGRS